MRNLKKVLALVLVVAMMMSFAVTASAFTDDADIEYGNAVNMLTDLGVLGGYPDGSFKPAGTITRAEFAKMIYALMNEGDDDASAFVGATRFSDVPGTHWASGYIAYCVSQNIIGGYGDGTYGVNDSVTVVQAAKMLLCALGYSAETEGYVGTNWSLNVVAQAKKVGMFDGMGRVNTAAPATREQAAQMMYNTLFQTMVEYQGGTTMEVNGATVTIGGSREEMLDDNDKEVDALKYYFDLKTTEGTDALGRPTTELTINKKDYSYSDVADEVYVCEGSDSYEDILDDLKLDLADDAVVYVQGEKEDAFDVKADSAPGQVIEMFFNSDDEIATMAIYSYSIVVVDDVEAYDSEDDMVTDYEASVLYTLKDVDGNAIDAIQYVDNLSEDLDDFQAIGSFAKGDILAVVAKENGTIHMIEAAETVDGVLTAKGTDYIKVDGTKYFAAADVAAPNYDDTYTYYLDPNGIAVDSKLYEEADVTLSYLYVCEQDADLADSNLLGGGEDRAVVKVVYPDGTSEVLEYALSEATRDNYAVEGGTIDKGDLYFSFMGNKYGFTEISDFTDTVVNGWYSYTTNSAGEVTLKSADKKDVSKVMSGLTIKDEERTLASGLYATTSTKVYVLNEDGIVNTYTGYKNFPGTALQNGSATGLVVYGSSSSSAATVYVYDAKATADTTTIDVALFVSSGDQTADGTICTFYVDGAKAEYTVADFGGAKEGQLFEIDVDDDGIATIDALNSTDDYKVETLDFVSDDYVVADSGNEYDLTSDCAVYQVSSTNKTVSTGTLDTDQNVVIFTNDDGAYLIFIYKDMPNVVSGVTE